MDFQALVDGIAGWLAEPTLPADFSWLSSPDPAAAVPLTLGLCAAGFARLWVRERRRRKDIERRYATAIDNADRLEDQADDLNEQLAVMKAEMRRAGAGGEAEPKMAASVADAYWSGAAPAADIAISAIKDLAAATVAAMERIAAQAVSRPDLGAVQHIVEAARDTWPARLAAEKESEVAVMHERQRCASLAATEGERMRCGCGVEIAATIAGGEVACNGKKE